MADGGAFLANARRQAAQVIADTIAPPPPVDLNRWALENIRFGSESPFPGPYNPTLFAFFRRILEVLGPEDAARVVVMMKSAQLGGTVLAQIFLAGCLDMDPSGFLYNHPTEPNAERWAKTKWRPMIRQSDRLRSLLPEGKTRDAKNSTLYQERADGRGWVQIGGANSPSSLSMISAKRQVQDDLSKWELNSAGDPETQADSRSKAYAWAKLFKIGTPLIEDGCRITRAFKQSTQEHFHVPCPHCEVAQALEWANLHAFIEAHPSDDPCFTCHECGGLIEQYHRQDMVSRGTWVAYNPGAKSIGFYLWAAYSPLESWVSIRDAWFTAKGDPAKEQAFLNDTVGLAYKAAGESPPWEEIRDRANLVDGSYPRGLVPQGGLLFTMGMDCQGDRVEWQAVAHGREMRRWSVDHGVVEGHISDAETRKKLDHLIAQTWPDAFDNRRKLEMVAIDGNAWTQDVYDWAKKHPASRVMMVRGAQSDLAVPLVKVRRETNKAGKPLKYATRFYNVGVSGMKMSLYQNLKKTEPFARGYCGFPLGFDDDYYQQLCAERRMPVKRKDGFAQYRWTKDANQRNEMLDTMLYAEAAATRLGWREKSDDAWSRLQAEIEVVAIIGQLDLEDMVNRSTQERPQSGAPVKKNFAKGLA